MRLFQELRAHLQYKIIVPFLLLTLLVALAGSTVAFLFIAGTAQERLNNQLAAVARATSDELANMESANLQFLHEVAFAGQNTRTGAPAVATALAEGNVAGLQQALEPYFDVSTRRQGIRANRLIVFDSTGRSVVDWERPATGDGHHITHPPRDLSKLWFVAPVLAGEPDALGDKFAGLLDLSDGETTYLLTVAPVKQDEQIVGGVLIATRLDTLLNDLQASTQAAIVTVYRSDTGQAFVSTHVPREGLAALRIRPDLLQSLKDAALSEQQSRFNTVRVNGRSYQLAYAPLLVRDDVIGLLSVGLSSDYVTGPWADAQVPLMILTAVFMLGIVGLGTVVARQITRPLRDLVETAEAVTAGELDRRSNIQNTDEVGVLARSFDTMTEHLLQLYRVVRDEARQRAAIVDSITDGVVVCDPHGAVVLTNRAMRTLLGDTPPPERFTDVPLHPLDQAALAFGEAQTADLFKLGERVVRVNSAPVVADDGILLGEVFVLQDLTGEVAIDRAKTNFIATISHELRTPLTVLGGSADLLLRGLVGTISDDQRLLIEGMRKHTQNMAALLNNVITIAGIEAGSMSVDLEPVMLQRVLDEVLWSQRAAIRTKGLALDVEIPDDLPEVLADSQQLRTVVQQLLDNARRYTNEGRITVRASHDDGYVRVDVIDTGQGISADLSEHLFTRFTRGAEGINSAERGIGLGLVIAKLLIERQGGAIWLDQTSAHGSTFSFVLPCAQKDSHPDKELATAA